MTMCPGQTVCRLLQLDCDRLLSSDRASPVSDSVFIVCDSLLSSDRLVTMCPGQTVCRLLQLDCDSLSSSLVCRTVYLLSATVCHLVNGWSLDDNVSSSVSLSSATVRL